MGSFEGRISIRTDSRRLYMEICRREDIDFGNRCGDIWQANVSTSLNEE